MQRINVVEATAHLSELLEAASKGESMLIVNDRQEAIAQLGPIVSDELGHSVRKLGTGSGQFSMSDDFDAPLTDFEEYQ